MPYHDLLAGLNVVNVTSGLYMGSIYAVENSPPPLSDAYDAVVSLVRSEEIDTVKYPTYWSKVRDVDFTNLPLTDDLFEVPDKSMVRELVGKVVAKLDSGYKVLIHCIGGANRSGLIIALVLQEWLGMSPEESITLVRITRFGALNNATFVDLIRRGYYVTSN